MNPKQRPLFFQQPDLPIVGMLPCENPELAVLKRPEHLRAAGATRDNIDAILDALVAVGTPVIPNFTWRPELSDPADEMVLATAVNGEADFIATFNLTHLRHGAHKFGIRVVRPLEALSILEV